MSQNIRPTPCSSGRQGSTAKVLGSGIAIMSDSSIALKPVIEEPSKPMPASKASVELGRVDREGLELTEDVREPEADEADLALRHDRLYVLGRQGSVRHRRRTLNDDARLVQPRPSLAPAAHGAHAAGPAACRAGPLVRAQNRHQQEQETERGRAGGDAVGVRADALDQRRSRARSANRGRVLLLPGTRRADGSERAHRDSSSRTVAGSVRGPPEASTRSRASGALRSWPGPPRPRTTTPSPLLLAASWRC